LTGFVSGQGATPTQTIAGTYDSTNVGSGLTVTATFSSGDLAASSGTLLSNYVLPVTGTGDITPRAITVTLSHVTKTYDGNTTADLTLGDYQVTGFLAGQTASLVTAASVGSYASPNVAATIPVSANFSGTNLAAGTGTSLSNYSIPTTALGTGTITPKALTIGIVGNPSKTYDGNTTASLGSGNYSIGGLVPGQSIVVSQPIGSYASANPGTDIPVSAIISPADLVPGAGTLIGNYTIPVLASGIGAILLQNNPNPNAGGQLLQRNVQRYLLPEHHSQQKIPVGLDLKKGAINSGLTGNAVACYGSNVWSPIAKTVGVTQCRLAN